MNKTKQKMNTYVKYGLIMLACVVFGGICGAAINFFDFSGAVGGMGGFLQLIRENMLVIMLVIAGVMLVTGELLLRRMKNLGRELEVLGEEESDRIEYELEKTGAIGNIVNTVLQVVAIMMLAPGYSINYIRSVVGTDIRQLLAAMVIFVLTFTYSGYWGVRLVKIVQKIYPDKVGDPTSLKFAKQWLESCDEAEKEMVYQAAYKSYMISVSSLQFLMLAGMICHLIWNTGIMAVVLLGILWLIMVITYNRNCVQKKRSVLS